MPGRRQTLDLSFLEDDQAAALIGQMLTSSGVLNVNPQNLGAKFDGVSDDWKPITDAMAIAASIGGAVTFPLGAKALVNRPLLWDKSAAVTPQLAPSLLGAPGYGGPTRDMSSTIGVVQLIAGPGFPVGEFLVDYIGPVMPTSTPQLALTSFAFQGLELQCNNRAAGMRVVQEHFFTGRGITVNNAAAPNPANATGGPQAAINLLKPTASFEGGYNNRLERCSVIAAAQDNFYCSEANASSVLLDHCVSLQPARYGFNCGPATTLRACDSQTAGAAEYFVIGTIMESCTIDVFAGSGNAVLINNNASSWAANPDNVTMFTGCTFVGTNAASLAEAVGAMVNVSWVNAHVIFNGCSFEAGSGTTDWVWVDSRNTNACQVDFSDCQFGLLGGGRQPSINKFNLNGAPASILRFKNCRGLNPFGPLVVAVPGLGIAAAADVMDRVFYIAAPSAAACPVSVGGQPTMTVPAGGTVGVRVPAGQTLTPLENLLSAQDASLEGAGTGTWGTGANSFQNCTLANTTAQALDGTHSLQINATTTFSPTYAGTGGGTIGPAAVAGTTYTATAWVRAATVGRSCNMTIVFYDAAGGLLTYLAGTAVADVTTGWMQVTSTLLAPANAAHVQAQVNVLNTAAGEVHYVDQTQIASAAMAPTWTVYGE